MRLWDRVARAPQSLCETFPQTQRARQKHPPPSRQSKPLRATPVLSPRSTSCRCS